MPRPHGPDCRCPAQSPGDGLLSFTVDCDHYEKLHAMLARIAARDAVVIAAPITFVAAPRSCDGSMTCDCYKCVAERSERVRRGVRRVAQPWEARRAA